MINPTEISMMADEEAMVEADKSALRMGRPHVVFLMDLCHERSAAVGWWDGVDVDDKFAEKIALIHSELSEALEGHRRDLMDNHLPHRKSVEVELGDAVIRIFDLAGKMKLDLFGAIDEKLEYNRTRADHKRAARAAKGGKKY